MDWSGKPVGKFSSPALHGSCITRRAQILAYENELGLTFALGVLKGKIKNQAANLNYFVKNRKQREPEIYQEVTESVAKLKKIEKQIAKTKAANITEVRLELMGKESEAARYYWSSINLIYGNKSGFQSRQQRGTKDPVNAALNYAYGVLSSEIWSATILAGLEPYAGFLHVDRPGRLSFVLDLIEEFRPVMADRVVFALAAKGWKIELGENGWLTYDAKRRLLDNLQERFDSPEPYNGRRVKLRNIIQQQAYLAAQHFIGRKDYEPFKQRW